MAKIGPARSHNGNGKVGRRRGREGGEAASPPMPILISIAMFLEMMPGGQHRKGCAAGSRLHASEGRGVKYSGWGRPTRLRGVLHNSACPHAPPLAPALLGDLVRLRSLAPSTHTMTRDPGLAPEEDAADTEVSRQPRAAWFARGRSPLAQGRRRLNRSRSRLLGDLRELFGGSRPGPWTRA